MTTKNDPFAIAERYIQLRRICIPQSWGDTVLRVQTMVLAPMVVVCLFILGQGDLVMTGSALMRAYEAWSEWFELTTVQFLVQRMKLVTLLGGGPFITTNDPEYLPYVWADGAVRTGKIPGPGY